MIFVIYISSSWFLFSYVSSLFVSVLVVSLFGLPLWLSAQVPVIITNLCVSSFWVPIVTWLGVCSLCQLTCLSLVLSMCVSSYFILKVVLCLSCSVFLPLSCLLDSVQLCFQVCPLSSCAYNICISLCSLLCSPSWCVSFCWSHLPLVSLCLSCSVFLSVYLASYQLNKTDFEFISLC